MSGFNLFPPGVVKGLSRALGDGSDGLSFKQIGDLLAELEMPDRSEDLPEGTTYAKRHRTFYGLWMAQGLDENGDAVVEFINAAMRRLLHTKGEDEYRKIAERVNRILEPTGFKYQSSGVTIT